VTFTNFVDVQLSASNAQAAVVQGRRWLFQNHLQRFSSV